MYADEADHSGHFKSVEQDTAGRWFNQAGDDVENRGLSTSGWSDNADESIGANLKGDVLDNHEAASCASRLKTWVSDLSSSLTAGIGKARGRGRGVRQRPNDLLALPPPLLSLAQPSRSFSQVPSACCLSGSSDMRERLTDDIDADHLVPCLNQRNRDRSQAPSLRSPLRSGS